MAYHPKSLRFLSVLQIIVGSISLLLGITSAVLRTDFTSIVGFGIWVGVWLGTFMGFTITACVMAGTMIICYSIALDGLVNCIRKRQEWNRYTSYYYHRSSYYYCYDRHGIFYSDDQLQLSSLKAGIGIDSVLLIIAVLEFAVGLASSNYCCAAICSCCNGTSRVQGTQQIVYLQPAGMGQVSAAGGGMVVLSGGPPSTVVQPPAGHSIIQQPGQSYKTQEVPAYTLTE